MASREAQESMPGRGRVLSAFAGLFLLNLVLRVFYLNYDFVNGDEAVRALTATRMLDGARLYVDIVTDKPPGTTLFYAAVFALFGRSMAAVHLAAIAWNFATSVVLYRAASTLYGGRTGLWAALLFIYFSTNYYTPDMMAANTELLMALPYCASFYFFMKDRSRGNDAGSLSAGWLFTAGFLTGVAALFKQVALFNLLFFAACEIFARPRSPEVSLNSSMPRPARRLLLVIMGLAAALALPILWLYANGAVGGFWRNAVLLGRYYAGSLPSDVWLKFMLSRTLGYVSFNLALWSLALWPVYRAVKRGRGAGGLDAAVALWGGISLSAVFLSGRFFGHYFIQALPALCLLASRGAVMLARAMNDPRLAQRGRLAAAALGLFFLFGLVRFHNRTAVLAYEAATGTPTEWSRQWGMTERESETELVAAGVLSRIGGGEPLFIWGYALDVYWESGCRPAARYLTPHYITGQFQEGEPLWEGDDQFRREARAHLLDDLSRSRPRLILDVEGNLLSLPYPEIVRFVEQNYRRDGEIGPFPTRTFVIYKLRE